MEKCIIRFEEVSKSYQTTEVLTDFNLEIFKGEFITIIGSSGSGKTTALKMINALISPDYGKVYVNNRDISKVNQIELRRKIGYSIQGIGLFPHMTVGKNISYVPSLSKLWNRDTEKRRISELLNIVGLDESMKSRYPNELSGGQKQRVGIARSLAANPEILLMDEPFGAVDEITRKTLQDEILKIKQNLDVTVIFVTHDIKEALKLGTRVLVMDKGKIVQIGIPEEIKNTPKTEFVEKLVNH